MSEHEFSGDGRDTREKLLDAAERLFAEQGFDSTSLRQITSAAGANLAAVNYHFGSKDDLIVEVLDRRIKPMNASASTSLERLEAGGRRSPALGGEHRRGFHRALPCGSSTMPAKRATSSCGWSATR